MPPLSQEMSGSHELCLLREKQRATWDYVRSHGLYQRSVSEPIRQRGAAALPNQVPLHSNPRPNLRLTKRNGM